MFLRYLKKSFLESELILNSFLNKQRNGKYILFHHFIQEDANDFVLQNEADFEPI